MVKRMTAKEARARLAEILGAVHYGKDTVIVEKQGKPMVAVVDIALYEKLMAEREAHFKVFDEIRARNLDKTPEEVERDVTEAIAEVRAMKRSLRGKRAQGRR